MSISQAIVLWHYCKKRGHIIKACRKRSQKEGKTGDDKKPQKTCPTFQVDEEEVCTEDTLTSDKGVKVQMQVAGAELEMVMDTGATVTIVPMDIYQSCLSHVRLHKSGVKLQSYCGQQLSVRGEAVVPVKYQGQETWETLVVVNVKDKLTVLGRNWLNNIRLDWSSLFMVDSSGFDPSSLSCLNRPWAH